MNRALMTSMVTRIRDKNVLVHLLTNSVVENFSVNALLAIGATAICTRDPADTKECAAKIDSLLINMGTFDDSFLSYVRCAQEIARQRQIPIVLDPVGCGFTATRMRIVQSLIGYGGISLIKGNYAEISALATLDCTQRGVDGGRDCIALKHVKHLSKHIGCGLLATGPTDVVCYGSSDSSFSCGHPLMESVIGMGCIVGAIAAAALAVENDVFIASCFAAVACGIAGEAAAKKANTPGSFQTAFIDALYQLPEYIAVRDDI